MTRRLPSLNALRTFAVAGGHSSFSKAAVELNVTPGAVSRQIGLLEQELGYTLFDRMQGEVRLTAQGRDYHRAVGAALDSISQATDRLKARPDPHHVTVNVLPTLAMRWLIPRMAGFNRIQPAIRVDVVSGDGKPDEALGWDLAIRYGGSQWGMLVVQHLFAEEMGVVCAPSLNPRSQRLDALPVEALLNHGTRPDAWEQLFSHEGLPVPSLQRVRAYEHLFMVVEAARLGQGFALVPIFLVEQELRDGTLVRPCPQTLQPREAYYLLHRREAPSDSAAVFKSWLLKQVLESKKLHMTR